jgi:hypothetical protein
MSFESLLRAEIGALLDVDDPALAAFGSVDGALAAAAALASRKGWTCLADSLGEKLEGGNNTDTFALEGLPAGLCIAAALRSSRQATQLLRVGNITADALPMLALVLRVGSPGLSMLRVSGQVVAAEVPACMSALTAAAALHTVAFCDEQEVNAETVRWWMAALVRYRPPALSTLDLKLGAGGPRWDHLDLPRGLEALTLSGVDDQLGKGLEACVVRCCGASLRKLAISIGTRYVQAAGQRSFSVAVAETIDGLPLLHKLDINGASLCSRFWEAFGRLRELERLRLHGVECKPGHERAMEAALLGGRLQRFGSLRIISSMRTEGEREDEGGRPEEGLAGEAPETMPAGRPTGYRHDLSFAEPAAELRGDASQNQWVDGGLRPAAKVSAPLSRLLRAAASLPALAEIIVVDLESLRSLPNRPHTEAVVNSLCTLLYRGRLRSFCLAGMKLDDSMLRALAAAVLQNPSMALKKFIISWVNLDEGVADDRGGLLSLARALGKCWNLRDITVSCTLEPPTHCWKLQRRTPLGDRVTDETVAAVLTRLVGLPFLRSVATGLLRSVATGSLGPLDPMPLPYLCPQRFPLTRQAAAQWSWNRLRDTASWGVVAEGLRRWQELRVEKARAQEAQGPPGLAQLLPATVMRHVGTFLEHPYPRLRLS